MEKPFGLGIVVGRFQMFHNGHRDMLNTALTLCDKVGVFIGSSQEAGTEKNPFSYQTRESILKTVFGNAVEIYPLPDIGVGNNAKWGEYVLENVKLRFGRVPDLLISGKESRRPGWFDGMNGLAVSELYVPKTVDISASRMREFLINGDKEAFIKYTDNRLRDTFEDLRRIVLAAQGNEKSDSI